MSERVGQQFGNYRLLRLLGRGGFAEVYLGQHVRLSVQQAAIKILTVRLTEEDIRIFEREAETISLLLHPHIIRLLDFDAAQGIPFLVMDYAPNGSLRQRQRRGEQVPLSTVVDYVRQIAEGLQYAHDKKIIHRDVKPDNMLVGVHNEIILSDFGIATIAHSTSSMSSQVASGTIPYMAPEQIQSHPRPASDQYALGITVYEWLTGERPFQGSFTEIAAKHLLTPPPALRDKLPSLAPDVEQVILHALAKEPQQRFATVTAFARALEQASQQAAHRSLFSANAFPTVPAERNIPTAQAQTPPVAAPMLPVQTPSMPPPVVRQPDLLVFTGPSEVRTPVEPETLSANALAAVQPARPVPGDRSVPASSGSPAQASVSPAWHPVPAAPVRPIKRSRTSNTVLVVFLVLLVLVGAVSYPLWGQFIFLHGSTPGQTPPPTNNTTLAQGKTGSSGPGRNCKKIGVLLPDTAISARWENNDRPQLEQQIPQALPGAIVDYSNAQDDATAQFNQAQADLTRGDCILVVAAVDSVAAAQIVTAAKAHNVPVIAYDRLIQSQDLAYYVSFDNVAVGKIQGQYIADHYQAYVSGGDINTAMINGSQTDSTALLFYQGVTSVLNPLYAAGTLKKVYDQFTPDWDNPTAQTEMESALIANNNAIQIVYVANDGMANAVIDTLKTVHLNGKVLVTGQDATIAGIQNILIGDQTMTVEKNFALEARGTAHLIAAMSNGTSTAALTGNAITTTSNGGNIPSVLETPVVIDHTNFQQVVTDNLMTTAEICQGLPTTAKYLPAGFCG